MSTYSIRLTNLHPDLNRLPGEPKDIAACGTVLKQSYNKINNRVELLTYVNNFIVKTLNYYSGSAKDLQHLKSANLILPLAINEIQAACQKDDTSEACILKQRFNEIKAAVQRLSPKASPPIRRELDGISRGIVI
jgi:hypothetical protein